MHKHLENNIIDFIFSKFKSDNIEIISVRKYYDPIRGELMHIIYSRNITNPPKKYPIKVTSSYTISVNELKEFIRNNKILNILE